MEKWTYQYLKHSVIFRLSTSKHIFFYWRKSSSVKHNVNNDQVSIVLVLDQIFHHSQINTNTNIVIHFLWWKCFCLLFYYDKFKCNHPFADIFHIIVMMSWRTGCWALFLLPVFHFLLRPVGHHGGSCWVVCTRWHCWPHNAFVSCGPPKETPRQTFKNFEACFSLEYLRRGLSQWERYEPYMIRQRETEQISLSKHGVVRTGRSPLLGHV